LPLLPGARAVGEGLKSTGRVARIAEDPEREDAEGNQRKHDQGCENRHGLPSRITPKILLANLDLVGNALCFMLIIDWVRTTCKGYP
jgi:hypothetical protein